MPPATKHLGYVLIFLGLFAAPTLRGAHPAYAAENGAAEMMLESKLDRAKKAKPAFFPHGSHQARLECARCHHGQDAQGRLTPFSADQTIISCESCHNSANTAMKEELNTFQKAGHALCRACHQASNAKLAKCCVCHKKDE